MILVTGASGTIGGEVVRLLVERGERVRAMSRDPERVRVPGVEAVAGDFDRPESLADAAAGAAAVFLLTAPTAPIADHDRAMVDAARAAGVPRVVKLSAIRAKGLDDSSFHLAGERAVQEAAPAWTILRPSSFASNTLGWAALLRAGRPVPNATGDAAQGVVDPRDIAEVAVRALTGDGHDGRTYTLTGPEAVSVPEQAAILAEVLGRPVPVEDLTPEQHRERLLATGWAPSFVDFAVRGSALARSGGNTTVTGDVAEVLGRPARTYRDWARDHRDAFLG
jgi:uncharacterized protein YbjT (DUF2867 family)